MSAFIVEKETIDAIVTYMISVGEILGYNSPNKLGKALWDMNHDAINFRYNDSEKTPIYVHTNNPASIVQVFKHINCFLYQCSEGDTPNKKLFKKMNTFLKEIAVSIVSSSKEYDQAEWN